VLDNLNEQIQVLLEKVAETPFEYRDLDLDQFLKETTISP